MIRILVIITTDFVPYGGLTTVMMNYYRTLNHSKFQMDFASTNRDISEELMSELRNHQSHYYCLGNRKKKLVKYISNLNRLLKKNKYDVVHVNSNSSTAAIELNIAKMNGVPQRIVHNHTSICNHRVLHKLLVPFFIHSYTDAIACSDKAGVWIFGKNGYSKLNNGINALKYEFNENDRDAIRKQYGIDNNTILVGHLGKIYKPKNHHFIVEVFEKYHHIHRNSKLILVGDGELREDIEKDVAQRHLNYDVIFAGMQRDVWRFLSAMDIFIFPSIWEGMPLSMIEAQASGLPCLCSTAVDKEVVVSATVKRLSIDKGSDEWVKVMQNIDINGRKSISKENVKRIKEKGYDVIKNSIEIEKLYSQNAG